MKVKAATNKDPLGEVIFQAKNRKMQNTTEHLSGEMFQVEDWQIRNPKVITRNVFTI